jgi:hypothetical protein
MFVLKWIKSFCERKKGLNHYGDNGIIRLEINFTSIGKLLPK